MLPCIPDALPLTKLNWRALLPITANGMLRQLEAEGLISRVRDGGGRIPSVYAMPRLINITEGRAIL